MKKIYLIALACSLTATVQASSLKEHYIDLFEQGRIPTPISKLYGEQVTCTDVQKPQRGFVGTIVRHGSGIALLQDSASGGAPRDVLLPVGNVLRGNVSFMRESTSGELILIGVKSFLGIRGSINPDNVSARQAQVLVCNY